MTNNSLSKDYLHPDDHAKQITDTPGFKPFTTKLQVLLDYSFVPLPTFDGYQHLHEPLGY